MSSPDATVEMAHRLEDLIVEYMLGATEEELKKFWSVLMPNISFVGINRIYPIVMETFPPSTHLYYGEEEVVDVDDDDYDVSLNPLRQPNPDREGTG